MRIRQAGIDDAGAISRLVLPLGEKFIADEFSPDGARTLLGSFTQVSIEGYLQAGYRYHVAEEADRIIGVIAVRDNSHIYHLFVDESYHRQGVGRHLWKVARDESLAAGNPGRFTVNSSQFAVDFYCRLGFSQAGPPECRDGVISVPMECDVTTPGG
ncbi:MAG: GNAT family N-acetyltransferase [Planctomycetaceae bacterium]|nr:GNAT family N-acetyltransferase [Planctomycetaceae bacterium]